MNDKAGQPERLAPGDLGETITPLREFVAAVTRLVERTRDEPAIVAEARPLLATLVAEDGWLPGPYTVPDPKFYCQYLLHCDPLERFSVVSFVWGPGQATPVHDHMVWGMIGVLRGAEKCQRFRRGPDGRWSEDGAEHLLARGEVDVVSPTLGDVHRVANAHQDRVSISIHVYGANIGAVSRHVYAPGSGEVKPFVSGYSSAALPNLWDRSSRVRKSIQGQQ
ncbi:MAG: cysteine dioxygenase [Burkholderiaceae bacterium]|nr:cysteine dioxygenase [Burkholderiaceae bacterium]